MRVPPLRSGNETKFFDTSLLIPSVIAATTATLRWKGSSVPDRKKEIAKFFCGFESFHTFFHAYLWLSGTTFTAFGITATARWNIMGVILNGGIAAVLGLYGWKKSVGHPSP